MDSKEVTLNPNVYSDEAFMAAMNLSPLGEGSVLSLIGDENHIEGTSQQLVSTSVKPICHKNLPTISSIKPTTSQEIPSHPSALETNQNIKSIPITQISPIRDLSKTTSKRRSGNTKQHSEIFTASPMKEKLGVLKKRRADKRKTKKSQKPKSTIAPLSKIRAKKIKKPKRK